MPHKSEYFIKALQWANQKHADHYRKDTYIPYFSHLMSVCALVMENSGTADEITAALLHDVIEDNEDVEREDVAQEFSDRIADIVVALSDASAKAGQKKPAWRQRKETYLEHLSACADNSVLLVSNADKLHNARCILSDLKDPKVGQDVWKRFSASKEDVLWYYQSLLDIYRKRSPAPRLVRELEDVVKDMANF